MNHKGNSQIKIHAIHLLDALFIDGENMLMNENHEVISIEERYLKMKVFVKSITKKSNKNFTPVRVKEIVHLVDLEKEILDKLETRSGKERKNGSIQTLTLQLNDMNELSSILDNNNNSELSSARSYVYVSGIYFLKLVRSPWSIIFSRSSGKLYYYNPMRVESPSTYEFPKDRLFFSDPK